MNLMRLIGALERNGRVFPALFAGWSQEEARWKPTPADWSLVEIAGHLLDEERFDFRARLDSVLRDADAVWEPIDPEGWVTERDYASRDLGEVVDRWVQERDRSTAWLRGLSEVDWSQQHDHPPVGTLRAGDLLASWVAHDALHLRQLARRQFQLGARDAVPFDGTYAGPWA